MTMSAPLASAALLKRSSTSNSEPRKQGTALVVHQFATASSEELVEVATQVSFTPIDERAARTAQPSTGSPAISRRTLPGSRLEPIRASIIPPLFPPQSATRFV